MHEVSGLDSFEAEQRRHHYNEVIDKLHGNEYAPKNWENNFYQIFKGLLLIEFLLRAI